MVGDKIEGVKEYEKEADKYSAGQIQVLGGLETVKKGPEIYIGSTSSRGLHHLVWEIVDNGIDECLTGFVTRIEATAEEGGSVAVQDDGRGIPVDIQERTGRPAVETVYTVSHAGDKFGGGGYKVSSRLHGAGASVVDALSTKVEVTVICDGRKYFTDFDYGRVEHELKQIGTVDPGQHGTVAHFYPDPDIFTEAIVFDDKILKKRIQELAFLNKGLKLAFTDKHKSSAETDVYHYEGGIKEYVAFLNKKEKKLFNTPVYIEDDHDGINVKVALQYTTGYKTTMMIFTSNIHTYEGEMHEAGSRTVLTRITNDYTRKARIFKDNDADLSGGDICEEMTAVISIRHLNPQFEDQTKTKLDNSDARTAVDKAFSETFSRFLLENPSVDRRIVGKGQLAEKARIAAKRAHEATRKKSGLEIANLPGKLAGNTSNDPETSELFIVEGDSAGGSAKQGRSRLTQAILPIRGKILDVEKTSMDRILVNQEIRTLFTALGTGSGASFNIKRARHHKLIIMTNADVGDAHIRTLLLTLFYRYMKPMIKARYIHIARPPLYQVKQGKIIKYLDSDEKLYDYLGSLQPSPKPAVQHYKGLGKTSADQLWETIMDPENRKLDRVDPACAEDADAVFEMLMGNEVGPRRDSTTKNAKYIENLDA